MGRIIAYYSSKKIQSFRFHYATPSLNYLTFFLKRPISIPIGADPEWQKRGKFRLLKNEKLIFGVSAKMRQIKLHRPPFRKFLNILSLKCSMNLPLISIQQPETRRKHSKIAVYYSLSGKKGISTSFLHYLMYKH